MVLGAGGFGIARSLRAQERASSSLLGVPSAIAEALVRARFAARCSRWQESELFVFASAKGGSGVTTVANLA